MGAKDYALTPKLVVYLVNHPNNPTMAMATTIQQAMDRNNSAMDIR